MNRKTAKHRLNSSFRLITLITSLGIALLTLDSCSDANKGENTTSTNPDYESNYVDIIVEKEPLNLQDLQQFQDFLKRANISSIGFVDRDGKFRAFTVQGLPIDLCGSDEPSKQSASAPRTCRDNIPSGDFMLRMQNQQNCPHHCNDAVGNRHHCVKVENTKGKWSCSKPTNECSVQCG